MCLSDTQSPRRKKKPQQCGENPFKFVTRRNRTSERPGKVNLHSTLLIYSLFHLKALSKQHTYIWYGRMKDSRLWTEKYEEEGGKACFSKLQSACLERIRKSTKIGAKIRSCKAQIAATQLLNSVTCRTQLLHHSRASLGLPTQWIGMPSSKCVTLWNENYSCQVIYESLPRSASFLWRQGSRKLFVDLTEKGSQDQCNQSSNGRSSAKQYGKCFGWVSLCLQNGARRTR
jgi:hypothetical protein